MSRRKEQQKPIGALSYRTPTYMWVISGFLVFTVLATSLGWYRANERANAQQVAINQSFDLAWAQIFHNLTALNSVLTDIANDPHGSREELRWALNHFGQGVRGYVNQADSIEKAANDSRFVFEVFGASLMNLVGTAIELDIYWSTGGVLDAEAVTGIRQLTSEINELREAWQSAKAPRVIRDGLSQEQLVITQAEAEAIGRAAEKAFHTSLQVLIGLGLGQD